VSNPVEFGCSDTLFRSRSKARDGHGSPARFFAICARNCDGSRYQPA
jgi:hypothetical protein